MNHYDKQVQLSHALNLCYDDKNQMTCYLGNKYYLANFYILIGIHWLLCSLYHREFSYDKQVLNSGAVNNECNATSTNI